MNFVIQIKHANHKWNVGHYAKRKHDKKAQLECMPTKLLGEPVNHYLVYYFIKITL